MRRVINRPFTVAVMLTEEFASHRAQGGEMHIREHSVL